VVVRTAAPSSRGYPPTFLDLLNNCNRAAPAPALGGCDHARGAEESRPSPKLRRDHQSSRDPAGSETHAPVGWEKCIRLGGSAPSSGSRTGRGRGGRRWKAAPCAGPRRSASGAYSRFGGRATNAGFLAIPFTAAGFYAITSASFLAITSASFHAITSASFLAITSGGSSRSLTVDPLDATLWPISICRTRWAASLR
jgi:hypothetical protein